MIDLSHALGRGAVLGLAFLFGVAQAGPSVEVTNHDGLLVVHAVDASMREVLEAVAAESDLVIQSFEPLDQRVSLRTQPIALQPLLNRLLRDHSYLLLQEPAPSATSRLRILSSGRGSESDHWQSTRHPAALPSVAQREDAVYAIADARQAPDVALLAEYLHDPSARVRIAAVVALADDASDDALHVLGEALAASDPEVRKHIVDTLADIDTPYATELLQQALSDEMPMVVTMASEYLAERLPFAAR